MPSDFSVRPAEGKDVPALGRLAGALVRLHHGFDPGRFIPGEGVEEGYGRWLGRELRREGAVVLVATSHTTETETEVVVGYAYASLEGADYVRLAGPHGRLHDVLVDESARGRGIGEALAREAVSRLLALGAPRVLLDVAVKNEGAARLFAKLGFRATMTEMALDASEGG